MTERKPSLSEHIVLTSHPERQGGAPIPVQWGDPDPKKRGPIVGTLADPRRRNAIGTQSIDLIFHQSDQGRNHQSDPRKF